MKTGGKKNQCMLVKYANHLFAPTLKKKRYTEGEKILTVIETLKVL